MGLDVDGQPSGKASDVILRIGRKEGWLQYWAMLLAPETDTEFEQTARDFRRLKEESGLHFAYLNPQNSNAFVNRIRELGVPIEAGEVAYYRGGYCRVSVFHKSDEHAYQREFRVVIDECSTAEIAHRQFWIDAGLRDIAQDCPDIQLSANCDGETLWARIFCDE